MREIYPKLAIVVAAAFTLSGCGTIQSIFGSNSDRMPELRIPPANAETAVAQATDEGRMHLDKGETGLAIEAFRRALSQGAPTAPALNGMGVAFARLGRYELAHRYFEQAATLDPSDERYAANLTRLSRSPAFAMRHDGDIAAALIAAGGQEQSKVTAQALAPAEPRPGRLTRVSSREYSIQTLAPTKAPLIKRASTASRFEPLVRIEFSKPEAFKAAEPGTSAASGRATVTNPHLGRTAAIDSRFRPIVRFPLEKSAEKSARAGRGD